MKRWSSLRRTAAPIPVAVMAVSSGSSSCSTIPSLRGVLFGGFRGGTATLHGAGAGSDRLDDVVITGATADVAFQLLANRLVVELVTLAAHDIDRRYDHAWRAVAALQPVVLAEGF